MRKWPLWRKNRFPHPQRAWEIKKWRTRIARSEDFRNISTNGTFGGPSAPQQEALWEPHATPLRATRYSSIHTGLEDPTNYFKPPTTRSRASNLSYQQDSHSVNTVVIRTNESSPTVNLQNTPSFGTWTLPVSTVPSLPFRVKSAGYFGGCETGGAHCECQSDRASVSSWVPEPTVSLRQTTPAKRAGWVSAANENRAGVISPVPALAEC
ncbi:hypothetical protein DFH09DRAFT_1076460 [Mycena vulgaris]|nr:hypothetical protein DFH09DRAFT_1076460 [Mycena vulgaris]